jgi:NO-binding membrane sensor protein with MHYT domain
MNITRRLLAQLAVYAQIYIAARIAFTVYRHAEGYYWLIGFLFISHDYFTLACFLLIVLLTFKISKVIWKLARLTTRDFRTWASRIFSGFAVIIALFALHFISMIATIQVLKMLEPFLDYSP